MIGKTNEPVKVQLYYVSRREKNISLWEMAGSQGLRLNQGSGVDS